MAENQKINPVQVMTICNKRLAELKLLAKEKYNLDLNPEVQYKLTGKVAGWAMASHKMNLNFKLLMQNGEDFVNETVNHEYAHLIAHALYNANGKKIKAHGEEWKEICIACGGSAARCHEFDVHKSSSL